MSRRVLHCAVWLVSLLAAPCLHAADSLLVVLAVDTSGSLRPADAAARREVAAGLTASLPPGSRVAVLAFDVEPRVVLAPTDDAGAVAAALDELGRTGRYTALHDAVFDGVRMLAASEAPRRALLLITDGRDENSAIRFEDAARAAGEAGIPVFAAGIGRVDRRPLRRLAKLTGGDYFPPGSPPTAMAARLDALAGRRPAPARAATPPVPVAVQVPTPEAAPAPAVASPVLLWVAVLLLGALTVATGSTLALVVLRRREQAPAPDRGALTEEAESNTLVTRLEMDEGPRDATLVLTLRPLLHVTRGSAAGKLFEVSPEVATSLGRAPGNDIVLPDQTVSHQHCRIRPAREGYELIDLGSTNGTFLNDRRVKRHALTAGDVIRLGETRLQFRMDHMMAE